jgi:hypothetical protein
MLLPIYKMHQQLLFLLQRRSTSGLNQIMNSYYFLDEDYKKLSERRNSNKKLNAVLQKLDKYELTKIQFLCMVNKNVSMTQKTILCLNLIMTPLGQKNSYKHY